MAIDWRSEEWPPNGQGNPLPASAGVAGQWIRRGYLFLYLPSDGQKTPNNSMAMALYREDGGAALGVDALTLAEQLGVPLEALFAHNLAGTLFIAARQDTPQRGGSSAITYRFRIGDAEAHRTFEKGLPEGRA